MIVGFSRMSYEDRLPELGLTTLETRRIKGDLLVVFKIVKGFDTVNYANFSKFFSSNLKGHSCNLY